MKKWGRLELPRPSAFPSWSLGTSPIADESAEGRVVSLLEGGYNLSGLASAATAHVQSLVS